MEASPGVLTSSHELVSLNAFYAISWVGFAACAIIFAGRIYIRLTCFGRFFAEDYLMVLALALILSTSAVCQVFVHYVYLITAVGNGEILPGPHFLEDLRLALLGAFLSSIFNLIALWLIKFNFLLFFKRLGDGIHLYSIIWWVITGLTAATGIVALGIVKYDCLLAPVEQLTGYCTTLEAVQSENVSTIVSFSVDILSDFLILCFPFLVIWKVRINLRQKLALLALLSVTIFTIAASIIRGTIFSSVYKSIDQGNLQSLNITWIWFWLSLECYVSFIVACLVSFRSLFARKSASRAGPSLKLYEQERKGSGSRLRKKLRSLHDSVLDACFTLEGSTRVDHELQSLPHPESGHMSVSFSQEHLCNEPEHVYEQRRPS